MKIGLVGSGGREHALAKVLAKNQGRDSLYVYASHNNPGISPLSERMEIGDLADEQHITDFFRAHQVELVVIGPETPLILGVSDRLRSDGFGVVGPGKALARLEGSKQFMRALLKKYSIPGSPDWRVVTAIPDALDFLSSVGQIVIKPVGLTGGKGVKVMGVHFTSQSEAVTEIEYLLRHDGHVLLEERLIGEEFSRMAFVSGLEILPMPVAQDFKYALDGDTGGMTGGMGAYTMPDGSLPFLTQENIAQADEIIRQTLLALRTETGQDYRGFLYGQFMAVADGVRLVEYNTRLGDPEAINVMSIVRGDLVEMFQSLAQDQLQPNSVGFERKASLSKYLVPISYPQESPQLPVFNIDTNFIEKAGFSVVFASAIAQETGYQSLGARVMALAGIGEDLFDLSRRMEACLAAIEPPSLRHRRDVGDQEVIYGKVARMEQNRQSVNQPCV